MTGKAQVQALVAAIGPLLELGEVTAFDAEDPVDPRGRRGDRALPRL